MVSWQLIGFAALFVVTALAFNVPIDRDGDGDIDDDDKILDKNTFKTFRNFQSRFGKRNCQNGTTECKRRKSNFARNFKRLNQWAEKNKNSTFTLGMTEFMDASDEDMKKMVMDPKYLPKRVPRTLVQSDNGDRSKRATATSFDWRTRWTVNPIRNQGGCGSCWAFAAVAAIEIQTNWVNKRFNNSRRSFSDQYILDCSQANGCNGGWPDNVFNYVQANGIARLSAMSYLGYNRACIQNVTKDKPVIGVTDLTANPTKMLQYVQTTGPVTACFYVCSDFYYYTSGVYSTACNANSPTYVGGHAVTVIGYGTTAAGVDYWIVRNQWGTSWGMDGYFLMKRGADIGYFETWSVSGPKCTTTA